MCVRGTETLTYCAPGIFEFYRDKTLAVALDMVIKLTRSIPIDQLLVSTTCWKCGTANKSNVPSEIQAIPKVASTYYSFVEAVFRTVPEVMFEVRV